MAFETLEQEKCGKCGLPAWHAFSEDNSIDFEMAEHKCESCAYKEQVDKKVKEEKPGITRFVRAVPVEGFDQLPSRKDFQKQMLKKALKAAEKKEQVT